MKELFNFMLLSVIPQWLPESHLIPTRLSVFCFSFITPGVLSHWCALGRAVIGQLGSRKTNGVVRIMWEVDISSINQVSGRGTEWSGWNRGVELSALGVDGR